jgi:peroxiredoxin family protein
MKKIKMFLFSIMFFAGIISSCNNEYSDTTNVEPLVNLYEFNGEFMTPGEIHNLVLKDALLNSNWQKTNKNISAANTMTDYIESKYNILYNFRGKNFKDQLDYFNSLKNVNPDYKLLVINLASELLPLSNKKEIDDLVIKYMKIAKYSNLSKEDLVVFYDGLSILESSASFWYEGEGLQYENLRVSIEGKRDCGGNVAASDWVGAVTGAALGGPAFALSGFFSAAVSSGWAFLTTKDCWEE